MGKGSIKEKAAKAIDLRELRRYRLSRVQEQLRASDVPAVLLFYPQNIRYATDIANTNLIWSFYSPVRYAFVPAVGLPILFEYALDKSPVSADEYEFLGDVRPAISFATFYNLDAKARAVKAFCDQIEGLMREYCGDDRRLAIDSLEPIACRDLIKRGVDIVEGDALMMRARLIKNSEEIKCVRAAVDVADLGAVRIRDAIRPGVTELDLWSILHQTNIEQGGEWIETQLLCAGARANPWYNAASDKVVQNGELVVFDTDLVGPFGYVGDISRAYLCGDQQPNADQKEAYRIAFDMLQHNMSLFKPGVTFRGISETCFVPPEPYQAAALGVAHGAGVEIEFPLVENRNGIDGLPYPDMALEPGMVLCAEAYIGKVGGSVGVKLEQQVVITANGFELLSKSPFDERLLN